MKKFLFVFLTFALAGFVHSQSRKGGSSFRLQVVSQVKARTATTGGLPSIVNQQGYIADSTGVGLNGIFPMTFGFFSDSTGDSTALILSFPSVRLTDGVFSVNLDVSSISFTQQYWLETSINGQILTPRTQLTSSPYALHADTADYVRYPIASIDSALYADSAQASHLSDSAKSIAAGSIKGIIPFADSSRASHIADTANYVRNGGNSNGFDSTHSYAMKNGLNFPSTGGLGNTFLGGDGSPYEAFVQQSTDSGMFGFASWNLVPLQLNKRTVRGGATIEISRVTGQNCIII